MKKIALIIFLVLFAGSQITTAQDYDDRDRLQLSVWVPENIDGMPSYAINNLENRLFQIATANGIGGSAYNSRFILSANVNVLTKDITPTAPPMHALTLNVTFYIGDGYDGIAFSSYSTTVRGVGENETRAYLAALRNIRTDDPGYHSFVDAGRQKIIDYYNARCDFIIREASALAGINQFGEALWKLTSVPDASGDCWHKAMDAAEVIFQQKIDHECWSKLNLAMNIWNAGQSWAAAGEAGAVMSTIDPYSACFNEVLNLGNAISERIREVDNREWSFTYDYSIGLNRDLIRAYRDVGVAWGNSQPQTIIYRSLW